MMLYQQQSSYQQALQGTELKQNCFPHYATLTVCVCRWWTPPVSWTTPWRRGTPSRCRPSRLWLTCERRCFTSWTYLSSVVTPCRNSWSSSTTSDRFSPTRSDVSSLTAVNCKMKRNLNILNVSMNKWKVCFSKHLDWTYAQQFFLGHYDHDGTASLSYKTIFFPAWSYFCRGILLYK